MIAFGRLQDVEGPKSMGKLSAPWLLDSDLLVQPGIFLEAHAVHFVHTSLRIYGI